MNGTNFIVGVATTCFVTASLLMPSIGHAQTDPRVQKSMETLKSMTANLGSPKVEGKEAVGGKDAPALYFGTTKMNNTFEVVDVIGKEDGKGMTATLFVKHGDEYVRVATSVPKPDGSGRAIGTVLRLNPSNRAKFFTEMSQSWAFLTPQGTSRSQTASATQLASSTSATRSS